jgi:hypothetical protein
VKPEEDEELPAREALPQVGGEHRHPAAGHGPEIEQLGGSPVPRDQGVDGEEHGQVAELEGQHVLQRQPAPRDAHGHLEADDGQEEGGQAVADATGQGPLGTSAHEPGQGEGQKDRPQKDDEVREPEGNEGGRGGGEHGRADASGSAVQVLA